MLEFATFSVCIRKVTYLYKIWYSVPHVFSVIDFHSIVSVECHKHVMQYSITVTEDCATCKGKIPLFKIKALKQGKAQIFPEYSSRQSYRIQLKISSNRNYVS